MPAAYGSVIVPPFVHALLASRFSKLDDEYWTRCFLAHWKSFVSLHATRFEILLLGSNLYIIGCMIIRLDYAIMENVKHECLIYKVNETNLYVSSP